MIKINQNLPENNNLSIVVSIKHFICKLKLAQQPKQLFNHYFLSDLIKIKTPHFVLKVFDEEKL